MVVSTFFLVFVPKMGKMNPFWRLIFFRWGNHQPEKWTNLKDDRVLTQPSPWWRQVGLYWSQERWAMLSQAGGRVKALLSLRTVTHVVGRFDPPEKKCSNFMWILSSSQFPLHFSRTWVHYNCVCDGFFVILAVLFLFLDDRHLFFHKQKANIIG